MSIKENNDKKISGKEKPGEDKKTEKTGKPYKMVYSETFVEPVGMGPVKEK